MKRNVLQLVLGLAAMAVVLVGLESQANAFGSHGSCGSHGGLFGGGSHGSCGGSHGGLFHRHGGSCGDTSCCEEKKDCGGCEAKEEPKEEKSCGCESSCNSCCGHHHRHRGCCNSGCESSCGGDSGCSACDKKGESAPAAPKDKDEKDGGKSPEMRQAAPKGA
jgi:hypothetical protein